MATLMEAREIEETLKERYVPEKFHRGIWPQEFLGKRVID
jgi:hypothetical protein